MKKIIFFLTALIFSLSVFSQAPAWQWAKMAGGSNSNENGFDVAVDANGNSYVAGYFLSSSVTFGNISLTNASLIMADIFIVKYDSSGNVLWAKGAGGTDDDYARGIAVDANGNCYITGYFESASISFGASTLINAWAGNNDIFVAKYDSSGNALWAKREGGAGQEWGFKIGLDASGNSYIAGLYGIPGFIYGGSFFFTNAGVRDIFIAKYDASGNVLWAKSIGGVADDGAFSIDVDANGNSYFTGPFQSPSIVFGSDTLTNNHNDWDFFIARYDSSGNAVWAKKAGQNGSDTGFDIAIDAAGNSYVTGYFASDSIMFGSTTLTNSGIRDMFIAKYDANGNVIWASNAGGPNDEFSNGVSVDVDGNSYVTGNFLSNAITIGSTTLTNTSLYSDIFIAKYDASGNSLWALNVVGDIVDEANGIDVDLNGNCFITGTFNSTSLIFGSIALPRVGGDEFFIAKLGSVVIGMEENSVSTWMQIFPNPATSELKIQSRVLGTELKIKEIEIYNVLGEKVFPSPLAPLSSRRGVGGEVILNVSPFPSGIYFVKVKGEEVERIAKFVKM